MWTLIYQLHGLRLQELLDAVAAELATDPGLLVAPERRDRVERAAVDVDLAGAHLLRKRDGLVLVAGPHRAGEAVPGVVGDLERLVLVGVLDDRQHRAEDLLLRDRHVGGDIGEDGGAHEVALLVRSLGAADDDASALVDALLDVADDALSLRPRHQRAEPRRLVERITGRVRRRTLRCQLDGTVVLRLVHEHPRPRGAGLTGVDEAVGEPDLHGLLEVRVGKNHVRALATELERDLLHGRSRELRHPRPARVEPVNDTMSMSGCAAIASPTVGP